MKLNKRYIFYNSEGKNNKGNYAKLIKMQCTAPSQLLTKQYYGQLLAQGHKFDEQDLNPHSAAYIRSNEPDRSASTRYIIM